MTFSRTKSRRPRGSRRAIALIELMVVIGVFSLFAVVAMRLVSSSLRIMGEVTRAEQAHRSFDAALARLRADVWAARSIDVRAPAAASLESGDAGGGATVTWSVAASGHMVRTESRPGTYPERQSWPTAGEHVVFRAEPGALVLDVPRRRGFDNGTYRLYSQVLLAEGGR